jgi:hypothetical protein
MEGEVSVDEWPLVMEEAGGQRGKGGDRRAV